MIALEGRIKIVDKLHIDIEFFVPYTSIFYGNTFPIYTMFPNPLNNINLNYSAGETTISYQKVLNDVKPTMMRVHQKNSSDIFCKSLPSSVPDITYEPVPCTLVFNHIYRLFDYHNLGDTININMTILVDITNTMIKFHWRKEYGIGDTNITMGSTDESTVKLSYNNDNTIQFIISDYSEVNNIINTNIAVREIESDELTHGVSILTPDIYKGSLYDVIKLQSNKDWIYNKGKYAKETTKTIIESKTEILDPIIKEDNDEQSGDNV